MLKNTGNSSTEILKKNCSKVPIEKFAEHFGNLNQILSGNDENVWLDNLNLAVNEHLNIEFTVEKISNSIKRLKNNKACGIDNIKNEFFKTVMMICLFLSQRCLILYWIVELYQMTGVMAW